MPTSVSSGVADLSLAVNSYDRATGIRYFIAGCGSDAETLRLLAEEVMPNVG